MSTDAADTQTGPVSVFEAVETMYPEPEGQPEVTAEEAQEAEPVESTEEEIAAPDDAAESEEPDPQEASEEPQHLAIDEYGDLTIPVVVNGQEQKVSLADAAKGYQLQSDYTRKSMALAEERKAFEAEQAEMTEQMNRQQEQIAQMLVSQQEPEPDWVKLAEELDPWEYQQRQAQHQVKKAERERTLQQVQARQHAEQQKVIEQETRLLVEKVPDFFDHRDAVLKGSMEFYGFHEQEVTTATDHRILMMANDARKWRESQKNGKAAIEKATRKPPKVVKPGAARGKAEVTAEQNAAAKKKLAKPGGVSIDEYLDAKGF